MAYVKYKDFAKRTESDKVFREKFFKIANNSKYDGYQRGSASTVYEFSDKKISAGNGVATLANKSAIKSTSNQQLLNELHKPFIRKFKRRRVYSSFKYNIWGVDLADMQSIRKELGIYYVPLIFLVNMPTLLFLKIKNRYYYC